MSDERGIDRRGFVTLGASGFVALGAWAALPAVLAGRERLYRRSVPVMGTLADLAVVDVRETRAQAALSGAVHELRRVEALMTRFRPDSDVGRANASASGGGSGRRVPVSTETAEVAGAALAWAAASDGSFDPCLGRAVALWEPLWDPGSREGPPPAEALRLLAGRALWRALEVETSGSIPALRLHDPAAALDLGGIAKGYGVDRALAVLRAAGVGGALVNVGGDLAGFGASPGGDPWRVGVRDPAAPDRLVATLTLGEGALATSGDYLRAARRGGRTYHHLLDPASAEPRRSGVHSLTVYASSCTTADAAATAAYGLPEGRAAAVVAKAPDARIVHQVREEIP